MMDKKIRSAAKSILLASLFLTQLFSPKANAFVDIIFPDFTFGSNNENEGERTESMVEINEDVIFNRSSLEILQGLNPHGVVPDEDSRYSPCRLPEQDDPFSDLEALKACSMAGMHSEYFDHDIADSYQAEIYQGSPPQAYYLKLNRPGVKDFCECTSSQKPINIGRPDPQTGEVSEQAKKERREKIVNDLAKESMTKIRDRFRELQSKTAYAQTSSELFFWTTKEKKTAEDQVAEFENSSTLSLCMMPEMMRLLHEAKKSDGNKLCGSRGVERIGQALRDGDSLDCVGVVAVPPALPECLNKSFQYDEMNFEKGVETAVTMDAHGRTEAERKNFMRELSDILGRHGSMAADGDFGSIQPPLLNRESLRSGQFVEEYREMFDISLANERSPQGRALWIENNAALIKAVEHAKVNNGEVSSRFLRELDVDRLKNYLETNPFLKERLQKHAGLGDLSDPKVFKQGLKQYVEKDLHRVYSALAHEDNNNLPALMGLTFAEEYVETLNECEEVQKTMISLCRALDTEEDEEQNDLSPFFTDARLMSLYSDEIAGLQNGESDEKVLDIFGSASHFFCEDVGSGEKLEQLHTKQRNLEADMALSSLFKGIDEDRFSMLKYAMVEPENRVEELNEFIEAQSETQNGIVAKFTGADNVYEKSNNPTNSTESSQQRNRGSKGVVISPSSDSAQEEAFNNFSSDENKEGQKEVASDEDKSGQFTQRKNFSSHEPIENYQSFQNKFSYNPEDELEEKQNSDENFANEQASESSLSSGTSFGEDGEVANSPIEAQLLTQLEKMQEREQAMMEQIAELRKNMEEEQEARELKEKQDEVDKLKDEMTKLKGQLAQTREEKATNRPARVENDSARGGLFGQNSRPKSTVRSNQGENQAPVSNANKNSATSASSFSPGSGGATSAARSSSAGRNGESQNSSSGPIGLRGSSRGTQAVGQANFNQVAPPDATLTSLALSAQGNIALRRTQDPEILEKVIFKQVDGEIVYENGHPVIEKTETLSAEEVLVAEEEDGKAERKPASIEEEMLEIERELRPRASHQELIKTLNNSVQE